LFTFIKYPKNNSGLVIEFLDIEMGRYSKFLCNKNDQKSADQQHLKTADALKIPNNLKIRTFKVKPELLLD
jgi:hypothetical protein